MIKDKIQFHLEEQNNKHLNGTIGLKKIRP